MTQTPIPHSAAHTSTVKPIVLNVSKKILNRESIFRQPNPVFSDELKKASKMTDQQVINSQIYNRMKDRLSDLERMMQEQAIEHEQNMKIMDKLIQIGKQKVHQMKYEVWEMKNEQMELEELLEEEIEENQQMESQWEEDEEYRQSSQDDEEEPTDSADQSQEESISQLESEEQLSKVSCSIKNLIPVEEQEKVMIYHNSEPVVRMCS